MNYLVTFLVAGPLLWLGNWAWALFRNYRIAKRSGLPVLICPFSPDGFPYLFIKVPLKPLLELIPICKPGIQVSIVGWEHADRYTLHEKYGRVFILANPTRNELWCADPDTAQLILTRRREFPQLDITTTIMSAFGKNVIATNGEDWSRQRRIVVPNLNERISEAVWTETAQQANKMVEYMAQRPDGGEAQSVGSLRAIAINVLSLVGYGQPKPFKPQKLCQDPTAAMSYTDVVSLCGELIVFAAFVPTWILRLAIMPKLLQTLGVAVERLPQLTAEMLDEQRTHGGGGHQLDHFVSQLVRLSDAGKTGEATALYLTEEEIAGNLFLFTAAGFDTTGNTLGFAVAWLAAQPKWQKWIQEELDCVLREHGTGDYASVFPKLTRCLAIMYETLRLNPAVTHIGRTVHESISITIGDKQHLIQAPLTTYINNSALHTLPDIWGSDSLEFRPSRWIVGPPSQLGDEKLLVPQKGAFNAWSGGPRVCPGQKMSQVEFVTVMATVFSKCNIEPILREGETVESASRHLVRMIQDTQTRLTMQFKQPGEVRLKWRRR
ncbi:cytochrome P450 [Podospora appendiculata]|uniref:Cytochrome P450 n=1 Tax=Podospora appendiculata TaxID=314037 RepID=A0AAE1C9N7_9PEZI|nr:cytochrome P450 [Podospora appendiculata]